jgi:hypothetical protein
MAIVFGVPGNDESGFDRRQSPGLWEAGSEDRIGRRPVKSPTLPLVGTAPERGPAARQVLM